MSTSTDIEKTSNASHSDSKLYEFLKGELNKSSDARVAREKLNSLNEPENSTMIYKMKLERDSLFSSVNDNYRISGSSLGVRTSSYLDHVRRYEMSKELISNATTYQRNLIRSFTDCLIRQVWRHRYNYLVKGVLVSSLFYNLLRANESKNVYYLRHANPKTSDIVAFYYSSALSFGFALTAFALI